MTEIITQNSKECNVCHETKPLSSFTKDRDKFSARCKACRSIIRKQRYGEKEKLQGKNWAIVNREKRQASCRKYYAANREKLTTQKREKHISEVNKEILARHKKKLTTPGILIDYEGRRCEVLDSKGNYVIIKKPMSQERVSVNIRHIKLWKGKF